MRGATSDSDDEKQSPRVTMPAREERRASSNEPIPGLLLVFSTGAPRLEAIAFAGETLELGRGRIGTTELDDERVSRRHASVDFDGTQWRIQDLGSRNGTAVDGVALQAEYVGASPRVVRVGDSLFLPLRDVRRFVGQRVDVADGLVVGPTLAGTWQAARRIASESPSMHIVGESGAGKELVARVFHRGGPRTDGPFLAVNCATIPEALAERLLFGARKGAYSGASESADGYLQAASGGTLFLDEVAELQPPVQAKLLRAVETREVIPLGAPRGVPIELRLCTAAHRDLRQEVAAGRFRADLFFRIGRPEVVVPPLRERPEEIPWLLANELVRSRSPLRLHASLVETCLLRRWPGNVRELLVEARAAMREAVAHGHAELEAVDLSQLAGTAFDESAEPPTEAVSASRSPPVKMPSLEEVQVALRESQGNVSAAARALGLHRTQLRRLLAKFGLQGDGSEGSEDS